MFSGGFGKLGEELLYAVAGVVGTWPLEKTITVMPILAGDAFVSQRICNSRSLVDVPKSGFGAAVESIKRAVKKIDRLPDCTVMQVKIKAFNEIGQDGGIGLSQFEFNGELQSSGNDYSFAESWNDGN